MKSIPLLFFSMFLLTALSAQEIIFEDLDPLVQEQLIEEDQPFLMEEPDNDPPEEQTLTYTYKGIKRDRSTDTVYCYRWDRAIEDWVNFHRTIKVFDAQENLIEQTFQFWARDNSWRNGTRHLIIYNQAGKVDQKTVQVWHPRLNEWSDFYRTQFTYREDNQIAGILMQNFRSDSGEWKNRHNRIFTYDEAAALIADTVQIWQRSGLEWANAKMHHYSYDSTGSLFRKVALKRRLMPGAPWIRFHREVFHYNDDGQLVVKKFEGWNEEIGDWVNKDRTLFKYNSDGKMDTTVHQQWMRLTQDWTNIHRIFLTYNLQGLVSVKEHQEWDLHRHLWVNHAITQFTYDASGTLLEKLIQKWNRHTGFWMNFRKWVVSMDYKTTQMANELSASSEDGSTVRLVFINPYTFDAPIRITGLGDQNASLKILDLSGKLYADIAVSGDQQVRLDATLPNGVYLIYVHAGTTVLFQSKLVIVN